MRTEPSIIERAEQPYAAITGVVTKTTFSRVADRFPEVFGWLAERRITPAGAPFFRYLVIEQDGRLEVEAGVPIPTMAECTNGILCDRLPRGRYASVTHIGHPDGLIPLTAELIGWATDRGLRADLDGHRWGCRLEVLKTHPLEQPDPNLWETELLVLLSD
jgi:effector-binding domain-containing protein